MEISSHTKTLFFSQMSEDIKEMAPHYLNNRVIDTRDMFRFLDARDYTSIDFICHKIKGSAAGFGFPTLTEIAIQIQENIANNRYETIPKLLFDMEYEIVDLYRCCLNSPMKSISHPP